MAGGIAIPSRLELAAVEGSLTEAGERVGWRGTNRCWFLLRPAVVNGVAMVVNVVEGELTGNPRRRQVSRVAHHTIASMVAVTPTFHVKLAV